MKAKRSIKPAAPSWQRTAGSQQRVVGEPTAIFSGKRSVGMWKQINEAKTIDELRMALYVVTCRCQELESEVKRLSNDPSSATARERRADEAGGAK